MKCRNDVFTSVCTNEIGMAGWDEKAVIKYYKPLMQENYCQIGKHFSTTQFDVTSQVDGGYIRSAGLQMDFL